MEEYKTIRILNEEPEFCEEEEVDVSADFFILCEEGKKLFNQDIWQIKICGMSILNWVVRACGRQPKILNISSGDNVLDVIRPYINEDVECSVVLFSDTPLLTKSHLTDLLGFFERKRLNVCKLKRGFVFSNEYIKENDEIYSVDEYDFQSDDFFVVNSIDDFDKVKKVLTKKLFDYHKRNGVYFENEQTNTIDANVEIGAYSKIGAGTSIVQGTIIGENSIVGKNVIIKGSKLENNIKIGDNSYIAGSIVKINTILDERVNVKNSVIGAKVKIGYASQITASSVRDCSNLDENVLISNSQVEENVKIGNFAKILGITTKTVIGANSKICDGSEILDGVIAKNEVIEVNSKVNGRVNR